MQVWLAKLIKDCRNLDTVQVCKIPNIGGAKAKLFREYPSRMILLKP